MRFWAHGAWWPVNRPHMVSWADDEGYGLGHRDAGRPRR